MVGHCPGNEDNHTCPQFQVAFLTLFSIGDEVLAVVGLVDGQASRLPAGGQLVKASAETQVSSSSSALATLKTLVRMMHEVNRGPASGCQPPGLLNHRSQGGEGKTGIPV